MSLLFYIKNQKNTMKIRHIMRFFYKNGIGIALEKIAKIDDLISLGYKIQMLIVYFCSDLYFADFFVGYFLMIV